MWAEELGGEEGGRAGSEEGGRGGGRAEEGKRVDVGVDSKSKRQPGEYTAIEGLVPGVYSNREEGERSQTGVETKQLWRCGASREGRQKAKVEGS